MGDEIGQRDFHAEDFSRFRRRLAEETDLVEALFRDGGFSTRGDITGFELEAWIVDGDGNPSPVNQELLRAVDDPLLVPELATFSVELNGSPTRLTGRVFSRIFDELNATWTRCTEGARQIGCRLVSIGTLPTVQPELLHSSNMSPMVRYQALNDRIMAVRDGAPLEIDIEGVDHLAMEHDDVMLEAATTSFQIHLQCLPDRAVRDFNASLAVSAPMVALAANSPFLFGRSLWAETRIPLFEQAVSMGRRNPERVTFGSGYANDSLFELFRENQSVHRVLIPFVQPDEPPSKYTHVRFQNGTVWRWNRPLLGFDFDGQPHVRIEHRVTPSGPTIRDSVANAAAYLGMVRGLVDLHPGIIEQELDFDTARRNFYHAAQMGLDADISWPDLGTVPVRTLLQDTLLPLAGKALQELDIPREETKRYLDIVAARVDSGRNGAAWQTEWVRRHGADWSGLTCAYLDKQETGEPVHTWAI